MALFRGYVETKNKTSIEKFKGKKELKTIEQVEHLREYAGVLAEDTVLVDIDDFEQSEILFQIVKEKQLQCRVFETTRGKHFFFKNVNRGVETNKTHCTTAISIVADMKVGHRNSYSILKFDGKERPIIYDTPEDQIQEIPKWLVPVKTDMDFLNMEAGDGRNQALFNYILTLQSNDFTVEESRECIRIINSYMLKEPLTERELETVLRDDAFQKPVFFRGTTFLHDKFATYLKNNSHIIKIDNQIHIYQDGIYINGQGYIEAEMIKHIPSLSRARRNEVYSYLEVLIMKNNKPTDANLIAFKNGVLNLAEEELMPFSPDHVITNKIDWNYNPDAYSELADQTLNKIACNDPQIRMLLEELIGYCFYRRNELGKAFILTGYGSNGKSTFLDMIITLLGENNITALDMKELGDRFKTAELVGKLANIGDDIGEEFIPNAAAFKKLVTGDRFNVERKGQHPFDFNNHSKMLFSANSIPRMKDKTGAVLRRLIIIPFNAVFSPNDPDFKPFIKYKLREAEVMEYLINLGIEGLKRVIGNQAFTVCDKVANELKDYEESNNPIIAFFNEVGEDAFDNEPTNRIYKKYTEYCLEYNLQALSKIEFSKQVVKRFGFNIVDRKIDGKKYRIFVKG